MDPVTTAKFQTLRNKYEFLMGIGISSLVEVEVWMIQMQIVLDEAMHHGIKLSELTYPVSIGFWGAES